MQCADKYFFISKQMMGMKRQLLHFYNKSMANGKWDGILTPEAFPPPASTLYTDAKPALIIGRPESGVVLWGENVENEAPVLTFDSNGLHQKWIEVFNKGWGAITFSIKNNCADWLEISETNGTVDGETRILLNAFGIPQPGSIEVHDCDSGDSITVRVEPGYDNWRTFSSKDYKRTTGGWRFIPGLDRMSGGCMEAAGGEGKLEYDFESPIDGSVTVEITRFLTLSSKGRIRIVLSLDGVTQIVESDITDEHRGSWADAIRNNGEKMLCIFEKIPAGNHTLTITAIDPYVTLGRITLYFGNPDSICHCNLGPKSFIEESDERLPIFDMDAIVNSGRTATLARRFSHGVTGF